MAGLAASEPLAGATNDAAALRPVLTERSPDAVDVIVSNCGSRFSYNIVRSLARNGLRVAIGQDAASGIARFSRYPVARFGHPPFQRDGPGFMASLLAAVERFEPAVYIPADEEIYLVARHRAELENRGVAVPIASPAVLERLHDKSTSVELAQSLGIPTPATGKPRSVAEVEVFAREHGGAAIVKVTRRLKAESRLVTSGVWRVAAAELPGKLERIMADHGFGLGDFLVQEVVPGRGYGVSMLFNEGRLRARFVHRRLRERAATGGPSTLRESVRHPELEAHAERLLADVRFHGVAMVEFRVDEDTGQTWFIEVNPRFWGSLALPIRAGVDFPTLLYRIAREGDVEPVLEYETDIRVRWLAGDASALLKDAIRRRRWPPVRQIFARADGYDELYRDDLKPFFAEIVLPLQRLVRRRRPRPTTS